MRRMETHFKTFIVLSLFFMYSPIFSPLCRVHVKWYVLGGIFGFKDRPVVSPVKRGRREKQNIFTAQFWGFYKSLCHLNFPSESIH